jgi:hypothetical protein
MLHAQLSAYVPPVVVNDGDESFVLEAIEAVYYELVEATEHEQWEVEHFYRLLRRAADFRLQAA